jgi:hypothetical protein
VGAPHSDSADTSGIYQVDAYNHVGGIEGLHIFCRRFSYPEMERINWNIEIVRGEISC